MNTKTRCWHKRGRSETKIATLAIAPVVYSSKYNISQEATLFAVTKQSTLLYSIWYDILANCNYAALTNPIGNHKTCPHVHLHWHYPFFSSNTSLSCFSLDSPLAHSTVHCPFVCRCPVRHCLAHSTSRCSTRFPSELLPRVFNFFNVFARCNAITPAPPLTSTSHYTATHRTRPPATHQPVQPTQLPPYRSSS